MSPLGLLTKIRRSALKPDAVHVLLAVAQGAQRWSDIRDATELQKWQMDRMLGVLRGLGLVDKHLADNPRGPGKCSIYVLTGAGITAVRELLAEDPVPMGSRPRPAATPMPLILRGQTFLYQK